MREVLRAEDIHVVRDGRPVLQEISLTVRAGEHWALLGANASAAGAVLVTHHLEELPAGTTHALLLRDGRTLAQGPAAYVLTGDRVGKCFDLPPALERHGGRWTVRIERRS
ncbi:hypothetical protein [Streptomyces sp. NBC_01334]|uniref:hypothetical protein n=1 Tax=Streptomyces sp. NBC_01334 TaxID=2903827 RepID=UPI002E0D81F7|nr:hypothetical protein OG736_30275 [Streptomyces sp. NBC_01334]